MNLYYLISVVGSRIFNLLTIVLLSYFLSAKSFGQYTIVATNAMLLHLFVSSWITNSLWRDASIASEQATSSIIARSIKYGFAVAAPLFAVVPLAFFWLATDVRYLVFILLIAPSILFIEIAAVGLNARREHRDYSLLNFFRGAFSLIVGMMLVLLGQGVTGALAGQIFGIALALLAIGSVRAMPKGALAIPLNWQEISPQIRFGLISALALNIYMLGNALSRNLIALNLGEAEAGYFSLAADMFYAPVALFATSLSLSSIPDLYETHGNKNSPDIFENGKTQSVHFIMSNFAVTLPYALGGAMTAPAVARLIVGSEMVKFVAPIAGYAAVQGACYALLSTLTTLALTQGRVRLALVMSLSLLGAIGFALGLAAHENSLVAYAQATTAASLLLTTGLLFLCQRAFAVKLPFFEIGRVIIASCVLYLVVWTCMLMIPASWSLYPAIVLGGAGFVGSALFLRSDVVRGLIRLKNN